LLINEAIPVFTLLKPEPASTPTESKIELNILIDARLGDRDKILKAIDAERAREKQLAKDKLKAAEEEKRLNEEKRALQKKAFIANKVASVAQAGINTAVAITSALTIPPPAGPILAALNAALGLAQVGAILAVPIPEFTF